MTFIDINRVVLGLIAQHYSLFRGTRLVALRDVEDLAHQEVHRVIDVSVVLCGGVVPANESMAACVFIEGLFVNFRVRNIALE